MHRLMLAAGVLIALVALAGCGGGAPSATPASAASQPAASQAAAACADATGPGDVAVAIANFAFDPQTVQASVGQVIEWTNQDAQAHSVVITGTGCSTDNLSGDASGALVFNAAGTYPYVCGIHSNMTGTVEVQ